MKNIISIISVLIILCGAKGSFTENGGPASESGNASQSGALNMVTEVKTQIREVLSSANDNESKTEPIFSNDGSVLKPAKKKIKPPPVIIDDFDKGATQGLFSDRLTSIGAFQGTWAYRPSWSIITKTDQERRNNAGKSQEMKWHNAGGWCGWYTLLDGLDATNYNCITFWVKGRDGGERFDIGLADNFMQNLEIDAKYVGSVNFFLKSGVTKEWQKVKIPLARLGADINLSSLGSLVFWFRYESPNPTSAIYIDDIMLEEDEEIEAMEEYNAPRAELDPEHPRTMWVWKFDPVLNLRAREDLLQLCLRTAIRTCYVYFGDFNEHDDPAYTKQLEDFLRLYHKNGVRVEILTGNPVWCLKENHHFAYNWVKSFLDYNKSRPPELRIDGCSFDVEPYLAGEWNTRRDEVKKEYLDLLSKLRQLIDSYEGMHFEIGGAIPFFYQNEGDFEEKMMSYLDYAALMAYYDTTRKILDCSRYHIDLATRIGKKIYIGVETQDLVSMNQGKPANTFYEEGWEEMERVLKEVENEFRDQPGYGGIAMHCCYSYKLLQRGRNTPSKPRPAPEELMQFVSNYHPEAVKIDGKLDEWNLSNPVVLDKKDQVCYGRGAWNSKEDYSLKAYSAWDEYNIYFAFDVTDNAIVQNKTQQDMWEGDHIEFWLDINLMADYNEAMNSDDDYQFGFSPGNFKDVKPEVFLFTPELDQNYYLEYSEISATQREGGYIIEIRLDAALFHDALSKSLTATVVPEKESMAADRNLLMAQTAPDDRNQKFIFKEGFLMGFSIDGSDCDDPKASQKLLMSTSKQRKWGDPTTFDAIKLKK